MKNKVQKLTCILFPACLLVLLMSSCSFGFFEKQPYVAAKYYDLNQPTRIPLKGVQLRLTTFNSTEPVKYKMVYHDKEGSVVVDDYNKWVQPPGLLLTRYLQGAFKQNGLGSDVMELMLCGDIFMFRVDLAKDEVSLGVNYAIKMNSYDMYKTSCMNSKIFTCKLKKKNPKAFVNAMSNCAQQLVTSIAADINKTIQHRRAQKKKKDEASKKN